MIFEFGVQSGSIGSARFSNISTEEVWQDLLASPNDSVFEYIGSLELGVCWLHFDVRNCERIMTYTL